MSGKYGCPWTNIMCIQSCGCCRDCSSVKKGRSPDCVCGIYRNHKNDPEIEEMEEE